MPMCQVASSEFGGEGFWGIWISRPISRSPYMRICIFFVCLFFYKGDSDAQSVLKITSLGLVSFECKHVFNHELLMLWFPGPSPWHKRRKEGDDSFLFTFLPETLSEKSQEGSARRQAYHRSHCPARVSQGFLESQWPCCKANTRAGYETIVLPEGSRGLGAVRSSPVLRHPEVIKLLQLTAKWGQFF